MNRRKKTLTLAAVAVALSLTGCAPLQDVIKPTASPKPSFDESSIYDQQLVWSDCGQNLECATASAPANWLDLSEGFVELRIARDPAGDGLPPLLLNPGGPGVSGIGWLDLSYAGVGTIELRRNYQLMAFDPRGTGESTPVTCSDQALKDELLYSVSPYTYGSAEDLARSTDLLSEFAAACIDQTSVDPALLNTQQAARDMDLWRQLLGQEQLNYLGYSYGTELGATYAALFPDRVGRMVLDGAIDVNASAEDLLVSQLDGFERAFRTYLTDCLAQVDCPFTGTVETALAQASSLLASLDARPAPSQDGRQLSIGSGLTGIIAALYSELSWPYLTSAFAQLAEGDGTVMLLLADFYNDRVDGSYSSNLFEANLAIGCADSRIDSEPESITNLNQKLLATSAFFGEYFTNPHIGCESWPSGRGVVPLDFTVALANPPLIIGTTGDPATPYQGAVNLAKTLDGASLLTYQGEGHTAYAGNSDCVDARVDEYFTNPTPPAASTNFVCD